VVDYTRIKKVVKTKHEVHTGLLTKSPPDANPWFQDKMPRPLFLPALSRYHLNAIRRAFFEERHPQNETALAGLPARMVGRGWCGSAVFFNAKAQRRKEFLNRSEMVLTLA
jgi:hypothetical protein